MSEFILQQQILPAPELIAAMTGSDVLIGELLHPAFHIVLDNQSTDSVVLSVDVGGGPISWKTFVGQEALVLDEWYGAWPKGTKFYGNGVASGDFSISYNYINYPT